MEFIETIESVCTSIRPKRGEGTKTELGYPKSGQMCRFSGKFADFLRNFLRPLPNILKIVFLKVVAAFEMLDSLGFMAPLPNIRSQDFV